MFILSRVFFLSFICIKLCFVQGAIISPILTSSMSNDYGSNNETSDGDWQIMNSTSSSPGITETLSSSKTSTFPQLESSSDLPMISTVKILSSFPSESFSTLPYSASAYPLNIGNVYSKDVSLKSSAIKFTTNVDEQIEKTFVMLNSTSVVNQVLKTKEVPSLKSIAETIPELSSLQDFHTPLMSLLVTSTSVPFPIQEEIQSNYLSHTSLSHNSMTALYNESVNSDLSTNNEHKKILMLVLRAEDCSKLSKIDFEKMLGKLMTKFGFGDAVPEISNAKCFSHLHINLTIGGKMPTLRFLPNIDDKNNITVDVLNRTFRVVKLEKIDLKFEKSKSSNTSSTIITSVAEHESIAYISVGATFGLVLAICLLMCCIKCCCLRKSQKRFGTVVKTAHVRLRPEDYTLTPIPRPTSLYVDCYRGSVTADIYSTTSAGSIASTTPTVDQGIIQPFDTSIVPLEDSTALQMDSSRDPSVESVPTQSNLKTFNINSIAGKALRTTSTDSKEQLNPKPTSRKAGSKTAGVANPTFQRY